MRPSGPPAVVARFAELVARATARAAREQREHLASLRPKRRGAGRPGEAWRRYPEEDGAREEA